MAITKLVWKGNFPLSIEPGEEGTILHVRLLKTGNRKKMFVQHKQAHNLHFPPHYPINDLNAYPMSELQSQKAFLKKKLLLILITRNEVKGTEYV